MKKFSSVSMLAAAIVAAGFLMVPVNSAPPPCDDTMTGGGWILTDAGTGNFGFSGGELGGVLSTPFSLNYVDEEAGVHVVATAIVDYDVADVAGQCRTLTYEVTVNGEPGFCATVTACDHGEPGTEDTFSIAVYGPNPAACPCIEDPTTEETECPGFYSASGVLVGGNNQLHVKHCD